MIPGQLMFGRYLLLEQIGAGGTGAVWKAIDEQLQTVALKRVPFDSVDDEHARLTQDQARQQTRLAVRLRGHPHVVTVYGGQTDHDASWLIMAYVPARSLRELLGSQGRLGAVEAARIGAQIADALAAAHGAGIEHRDVKPGNVLIAADGSAKLSDFGVSHLTGNPHLAQGGIPSAPVAFMAPEVAARGEFSPASDIFSLGATLYTAVEGRPPFGTGRNTLRLLNRVRSGVIRPPLHAGPLAPVLRRLLHPSPGIRPDAATTRDLLRRLADPTPPVRHAPWWRWRWRPGRRPGWPGRPVAIGATALVGVAAAGVFVLFPLSGPGQAPRQLRDADPCSLLDSAVLHPFGTAVEPTIAPLLQSCQLTVTTAAGDVDVRGILRGRAPVSELGEPAGQVGNTKIFRKGGFPGSGDAACSYYLESAGAPVVHIVAVANEKPVTTDSCAVAEVAAGRAADTLAEHGIEYELDRAKDRALAHRDACTLLHKNALDDIAGLDQGVRKAGYANWSCTWGDKPSVGLGWYLYRTAEVGALGEHGKTAGQDAYLQPGEPGAGTCRVLVAHRPGADDDAITDMFTVDVNGPAARPTAELCSAALDLAASVENNLSDPRDADPCALTPIPARC